MNTLNLLNREPVEYIVCDMRKQELTVLNGRSEYKPYNNTLERTINQASKLQFNISIKSGVLQYLTNDNLIKYKSEYYIINDISIDDSDRTVVTITATHECSELNNKQNGKFEEIAKTVQQLVSLVLVDTDWVFGGTDIPDSKKRYLLTENESVFTNLVTIAEVFNARLDFNISPSGVKSVSVYQNSIKNGRYITKGKDLKNVSISYNTDDMVTRLTPFGAVDDTINQPVDIMDVNPTHKSYIDNFKYYLNQGYTMEDINKYPTKFIKEKTIDNTDCRTSQQLYDWATEELERISIPKVNCSVGVADISVLEEFMLEPYSLGETVTIFDTDIDLEVEADINSIQENLDNPFDSTISISNIKEKNSVLKKMVDSANVVDKVVDSNNQIKGTYIAEATIDTAHIRELNAKVIVAESIYGDKIHANTISGKHIISGSITAEDAVFSQGAIGNADISDLSANKLTAGIINTGEIKIVGTDNVIEIENGQILVNDTSNLALPYNRLIMGKYKLNPEDEEWKYGFVVRGADGKTVLLDENGVTNAGITDGAIDNNKISVDANIDGSKLNIQTTIKALNNYTGSEKLSGVIIEIDGKSLSSKFYEMDNLITAHGELLDKHTSAIQQNANNIKLSVTQQTYYKDKQQLESDLKNVQDSIANIQIGGNNLFIGTKDWSSKVWENVDIDEEIYQGCKVGKVKGMSPNCITTNLNKHNFKFTSGQTYTVSMCAKGKIEGLKLSISISQARSAYEPQVVTTDWALYTWTFDSLTEDLINFLIQSENATDTNYISVCRLKVELGNKATDWCPSFDDSSLAIEDVKQQLNDIKADNKLTPNEKQDLLREITAYKAEKFTIDLQCSLYPEVSVEQSNFNVAYNSLIDYIDPLLDVSNINETTEINAETFTNYFNQYFETKTTLLSKLSKVSKDKVDNAQNTAETAQENAAQAQKDIDKLNNINELTPSKKQELNKEWINIKNSYTSNMALANIYSDITTDKDNYSKAYSALNSLLPSLLSNLTTTETIDGVNLTNKLTDFYDKQNILLKKINEVSKSIADNAKNNVENLQIGGRNLILNSAKTKAIGQTLAAKSFTYIEDIVDTINSLVGKTVVLSVDVELDNYIKPLENGNCRAGAEVSLVYVNGTYGYVPCWVKPHSGDSFSKKRIVSIPFVVREKVEKVSGGVYVQLKADWCVVSNPKLEIGNKATDWTPAPEDTQSILDDIFADNMITPNEKQSLSREWEEIKSEYIKNKDVATQLKIVTELTSYTEKYNNLKTHMDTILSDLNLTTSINPQEFNTAYNNYINSKVVLLSKISTETKKLADNAQNTANTANQTANENAGALNNMTRDDKITPVEKLQVDNIMQQIIKEKTSIVTQAQVFNISTTDYISKYNALYAYMYGADGLLVSKNVTSDIIRSDFQGYFNNYYISRQAVLNTVTQKSKEASDKALEDSKKYTDSNVEIITQKFSDLGARVEVTENAISDKVWKTDITTETTKVIEKIDNMKIGVRNLLLDSGKSVITSEYLIKRYDASLIKPNTKYTLVLRGKISEGKKFGVWFNGLVTVVSYVETGVNSNTKVVQFTSPSQITHQLVSLYNYPSNISGEATVEWVTMYEGHIKPPLDWIPAPEDTQVSIDNIQLGGRNLLVNNEDLLLSGSDYVNTSKREKGKVTVLTSGLFNAYTFVHSKVTNNSYLSKPVKELSVVDKYLTFSADIKTTNLTVDGVRFKFDVREAVSGQSRDEAIINITPNRNGEWVRYSATLKVTSIDRGKSLINLYSSSASLDLTGCIIEYRNVMIEEGNKASAYSKAPEDIENNINNLESTMNGSFKDGLLSESEKKAISQSLQIIKGDLSGADNTYLSLNNNVNLVGTPKTNLTNAKVSYNSAYNSLVSFINTALSASIVTDSMKSSIDSAFNTYRTALGGFNTRVQEAIDSINSKKVDDIEVGGRNLLRNTSKDYKIAPVGQYNAAIIPRRHCSEFGLKAGDTITFGVDLKSTSDKPLRARIDFYSNATGEEGKTANYSPTAISSRGEGRSCVTATIPSGKEYIFLLISNMNSSITTSTNEQYKCAMLEKGNKPSAWSPAPEDIKDFATEEAQKVETKVTEKVTEVTKTIDGIKEEIKSTTNKITTITKDLVTVETLARAMSNGKPLRTDPTFRKGTNGVTLYNSTANGNVSLTRIARPSDCPTTSTHCLQYKCIGVAAPSLGGFMAIVNGRANAKFVIRVIAKIPVGYNLNATGNAMGTGAVDRIITDSVGTGNYQEYIRLIQCGSSGSFGNSGHFYISGATPTSANPLYVNIASVELYDITDSDERLNELTTSVSENTEKIAQVDKKADLISNRVKTTEENVSTINGNITSHEQRLKTAETKLTDSNFAVQIQRNQNKVYRFRYIRDYINGSTVNSANHWAEIQAIDNLGVNVAKGKTVGSNDTLTNGTLATDGILSNGYANCASGLKYIQVDLESVYENIDCLKIWHYYSDGRTYHNTKTQISTDGTNWTTVFDSSVSGEYKETKYGHTIKLNDIGEHNSMMDFSENGLRVSHSNANLDTIMDAEGFYIVPEGLSKEYSIASFAGNSSYQSQLNVSSLSANESISLNDSILYSSMSGDVTMFVAPTGKDIESEGNQLYGYDINYPFKSLDYAINKIPKNIPQGLNITLVITGEYAETLWLSNFMVGGSFIIALNNTCHLDGGINAYGCYGNIRFNNYTTSSTQQNLAYIHHVYCQHCQLRFEGNNTNYLKFGASWASENAIGKAVNAYHSEILFDRCDFGNSIRYAWWGTRSVLWHMLCRGNTESCFIGEYGCRIICVDTDPNSQNLPVSSNYKYKILRFGSQAIYDVDKATPFASQWQPSTSTPPPTPTIKTYTTTWTVTSVETYVPVLGTYEAGKCRQGWYASNRGNYFGMANFNVSSIKSTLSGATITASSVTITRENSSHGYNSAQTVYVVGKSGRTRKSAYASKSGFNRGTTQTISCGVTLGNNLRDGVVDGIGFYAPNANTQYEDYVVIAPTTIKITVTYQK